MTKRSSLYLRLSTQPALLGLLQAHPNPVLTEIAGLSGYDFLFLDGEHGLFSDADYLHALQVLASVETLGLVRVAGHDLAAIGRYLDIGADGIIVPNVSTAEQAQALARAMTYPPAGTRGFGAPLHRATRYGRDLPAHMRNPREEVCLLPIIESAVGAANVAEILAVDGVDGIIIGSGDLSADLGCPGDFSQPAYAQALVAVEQAAAACGKLLGTAPNATDSIDALLVRGYRFFIIGSDTGILRQAMSAQVTTAKSSFEKAQG